MNLDKGFTLIELMIVVAIIGILASIALPSYQTYTNKAKYSEVILAVSTVKLSMETCLQEHGGDKSLCDTAKEIGVNLAYAAAGDHVGSVTVSSGTVSGKGGTGIESSFVMTTDGTGTWKISNTSTCINEGLC